MIQFDTNYREATAIFGLNKKNALTFEERQMLMKQEKCFKCRKTGHRAANCPDETDKKGKKKEEPQKVDLVKDAFTTI